jgi:hypothetical protein
LLLENRVPFAPLDLEHLLLQPIMSLLFLTNLSHGVLSIPAVKLEHQLRK